MSAPTHSRPPGAPGRVDGPGRSGLNARAGRPSHRPSADPEPPTADAPRQRFRPGFGLRGPRRDPHVLPATLLDRSGIPVGGDGVLVGIDPEHQPAVLGLLRPTALDVVLVGGVWMAQVLAMRTVAAGARAPVETARPQAWGSMARAAGAGQQCVTVHEVGDIAPQGPSVSSPVLFIRDCGARPPRNPLAPSAWQTVLTVLPFMGPKAPRLLARAQLVGLQRLSPQEADVAARIMRLPQQVAGALPTLSDNAVLWCTPYHHQFVLTQPTDAETGLLGSPRRMD